MQFCHGHFLRNIHTNKFRCMGQHMPYSYIFSSKLATPQMVHNVSGYVDAQNHDNLSQPRVSAASVTVSRMHRSKDSGFSGAFGPFMQRNCECERHYSSEFSACWLARSTLPFSHAPTTSSSTTVRRSSFNTFGMYPMPMHSGYTPPRHQFSFGF